MDTLSAGRPLTMLQNIAYALPPRRLNLYTSTAGATLVQSNDPAMAATTVVTLTEGQYSSVSGGFIKSTAGAASVILKPD